MASVSFTEKHAWVGAAWVMYGWLGDVLPLLKPRTVLAKEIGLVVDKGIPYLDMRRVSRKVRQEFFHALETAVESRRKAGASSIATPEAWPGYIAAGEEIMSTLWLSTQENRKTGLPFAGDTAPYSAVQFLNATARTRSEKLENREYRSSHQIQNIAQAVAAASLQKVLLGYRHPVHSFMDWTQIVEAEQVLKLLAAQIMPQREQGLDLLIASLDLKHLWITNHDGDAYYLD